MVSVLWISVVRQISPRKGAVRKAAPSNLYQSLTACRSVCCNPPQKYPHIGFLPTNTKHRQFIFVHTIKKLPTACQLMAGCSRISLDASRV